SSWLGPSGPEGYASQQSGSFLAGQMRDYPADPIRDCSWGCRPFEAMRNRLRQQPAAVQVAAATRVVFDDDRFAELGQVALGIGIMNNDVSDTPYDGIDVGWGWGANDPGGSPAYRTASRGYYDQPGNLTYDTPTILRDTVVVANRVSRVKQWYPDGGAIYHLSADPGALIAENYISDVPGGIALYLDEGSRYVTVRNNVVENVGVWLTVNSQD